jgi:peptidoglycan/xylan/chitin deacetylase (PgdA/CDA1 family)
MKIALKIDADTLRGTRHGVPRLVEILKARDAGATFLFSLGPDHTGRALARVFRRGFIGKVRRTSVISHYGLKTLLYGTVLPGPDIGRECAGVMRDVRDAGFEVGIHAWDHVLWQDNIARANARWTLEQMTFAQKRFREIFGADARVHGAAGWQMNAHAWGLAQRFGFEFCSDTRGSGPFIPMDQEQAIACPQLPTTLPTLDEMLGVDGTKAEEVIDRLLERTRQAVPHGHVFTLHAELEGMKLAPLFERLLEGWHAQGHELVSLGNYLGGVRIEALPRHEIQCAEIPGRTGTVAMQGRQVEPASRV